jgi:uncharacterized protein (TIGR02271 family)
MRDDTTPHDRQSTGALARLDELDDFGVADGYPDPRGWEVRTRDGRTIGTVRELLVDREAMRVRYLDVELAEELQAVGTSRVHVPVASAQLDDERDDVIVDLDAAGLGTLGLADTSRFDATDARHDDSRFFGNRVNADRARGAYLTLHEERLAVGKRATTVGEVEVRKTVETEHVRESVPVMHEEVTIERRPISADTNAATGATIDADGETIRVPLMAEEIVTEKRVVPVEEVVIRKEAHVEDRVVEETVRRERVDIDRDMDADAARRLDR